VWQQVDGSDFEPSSRRQQASDGYTHRDLQYMWRARMGLSGRFRLTDGNPNRPSQTPKARRERYARMRRMLGLSYTPMPQKGRHRMPARDSLGRFLPSSKAARAGSTRPVTIPGSTADVQPRDQLGRFIKRPPRAERG
jgi:hypothetical protein